MGFLFSPESTSLRTAVTGVQDPMASQNWQGNLSGPVGILRTALYQEPRGFSSYCHSEQGEIDYVKLT
jgi:hypothetical protein